MPPSRSEWHPERVTYRRYLLDRALEGTVPLMRGTVVDIGGKRARKRGDFRPPEAQAHRWIYVNLARETAPDIVADAGALPLRDGSADCVICTEVLEHLPDPAACVAEGHRLLRPGGTFIASVPFLYPVHADPHDYQRFTAEGLRHLFAGFTSLSVETMGGFPGVLGLLLELGLTCRPVDGFPARISRRVGLLAARVLCRWDIARSAGKRGPLDFTTGYFVTCVK